MFRTFQDSVKCNRNGMIGIISASLCGRFCFGGSGIPLEVRGEKGYLFPMTIEVSARVFVPQPRERVFQAAAGETAALSRYFTGYPPLIPAIIEAEVEGGDPPRAGALRRVRMSDGSRIVERILAFEAPSLHRYDMAELNPLQRLLCVNMVSEWRFEAQGSGTRVTWDYSIHPRALRGAAAWLMGGLLRKAMQRCLDNLAADLR
jgi:uncharacterized protein YndB with AHSA1/START domain